MAPSDDQVRHALGRVSTSEQFRQSDRLRTFLEYIVEETLNGRADRIKSYSIGLEVFGRRHVEGDNSDGVVRTTAIRLRDALERYYRGDGSKDEVIIALPKGRYVPEFHCNSSGIKVSQSVSINVVRPSSRWRLALLAVAAAALAIGGAAALYPLLKTSPWARPDSDLYIIVQESAVKEGGAAVPGQVGTNFSEQLVEKLVEIGTANIIGPTSGTREDLDKQLAAMTAPNVLVLRNNVQVDHSEADVSWRLSDARSDVVLWAGESRQFVSTPAGEEELASAVAFSILGTDGAVSLLQSRLGGTAAGTANCIPNAQRLAVIFDTAFQTEQRECLEHAVGASPHQGELWALLSMLYVFQGENETSLGQDYASLVQKAADAMEKANELSPNSFLTQQAQLYVAYALGQSDHFEDLGRRMMARYPGDPNLKLRIGSRLIVAGKFDEGRALVEEGMAAKDGGSPWDHSAIALGSIGRGDFDDALSHLDYPKQTPSYMIRMLRTVALAGLGRMDEAATERDLLLDIRPDYGAHFSADMAAHHMAPGLVDAIAAGLTKAGLALE